LLDAIKKMTELQINTRRNVERFFAQLSSKDELNRYKSAVPFVHIQDELFAQWESFTRIQQEWYKEIWSSNEWENLIEFDRFYREQLKSTPSEEIDFDVPEILETQTWIRIMTKADMIKGELKTAPNNR
jgi:hypothetical protein